MKIQYRKIAFSSSRGQTAGLIIDEQRYQSARDICSLSRLFPYSEAHLMERIHISEPYMTWGEAFNHQFTA